MKGRNEPAKHIHIELRERSSSPEFSQSENLSTQDTKVYVAGIPNRCSEQELKEKFNRFGPIRSVQVIRDQHLGKWRSFGFLVFVNVKDAEAAIAEMDN